MYIRVNFRLAGDVAEAYPYVSNETTTSILVVGETREECQQKAADQALDYYRKAGAIVNKSAFVEK